MVTGPRYFEGAQPPWVRPESPAVPPRVGSSLLSGSWDGGGPALSMVTWCGWHPKDLLAEPGILLSWVCVCLCVQDLVHLGKHNLPEVEETLGRGQR